jgi:hypothetical protein
MDKARGDLPEHHARDHTARDPDGQITLKGIQLLLDYWWRTISVVSMSLLNQSSRIIDRSNKKVNSADLAEPSSSRS